MEHKHHTTVLYVLLCLVLAWTIYMYATREPDASWQCSNVICAQYSGPQEWVNQNCFEAPTEQGEATVVCRVTVNGTNRLLPLNQLDLSQVGVCLQAVCTQEIYARAANYTINLSESQ
jgi:hypothetical protein